jgi:hypothetical protein
MRGAVLPQSQYVFMAWCLFEHRDNFTFSFKLGRSSVKVAAAFFCYYYYYHRRRRRRRLLLIQNTCETMGFPANA